MLAVTDAIEERDPLRGSRDGRRGVPRAGAERGRLLRAPRGLLRAGARDLRPLRRAARVRRGDLRVRPARATCSARERYDYLPDMITCAKGLTSGYSPLGAVICRDFLAEPFLEGTASFAHGITFGGHPVSCAVALANLDMFERGARARQRAAPTRPGFQERLDGLRDLPIVGDVRGAGYFWALELVTDHDDRGAVHRGPRREALLRGFLAPALFERGPDLPGRRPRRPGRPARPAAHRRRPSEFDDIEPILRTVPHRGPGRGSARIAQRRPWRPRRSASSARSRPGEHRVAITPDGVRELVAHDVTVLVEARRRRRLRRSPTTTTRAAGAEIVDRRRRRVGRADLVVKVKEPQAPEFGYLRPDLVLFTYLHLAAYPRSPTRCSTAGTTGIAYETVQLADGALPAARADERGRGPHGRRRSGAHFLERAQRRPRRAARRRARRAAGARRRARRRQRRLERGVDRRRAWRPRSLLLDKNLDRLRWVDQIHQGRIMTLASQPRRGRARRRRRRPRHRRGARPRRPGAGRRDRGRWSRTMKPGAVIVDVAVDQGGCIETTHETTHADPVYERARRAPLRRRQHARRGAAHVDLRARRTRRCRTCCNSRCTAWPGRVRRIPRSPPA